MIKKKKLILMPGAYNSPPARFRILQFVKKFQTLDFDVEVEIPFPDRLGKFPKGFSFLNKILHVRLKQLFRILSAWWKVKKVRKEDIVIVNRDIIPELRIISFEKKIKSKGGKLIIDFDDAIFVGPRGKKLDIIFPLADHLVAGNDYLLNYAKTKNSKSKLIPTVVDTDFYVLKEQKNDDRKVIVGWSGSASTNKVCLPLIKEIIEELSEELDFIFMVISNENPKLAWNVKNMTFMKWTPETEVEGIQKIDIGLMPLNDNNFEKGKCGLKAIQYMAVGTPAIVAPIGVNEKIVSHGIDGFHATTKEEWKKFIRILITDDEKRKKMGLAARKKIEDNYSLKKAFILWEEVIRNI